MRIVRILVTLVAVAAAAWCGYFLWRHDRTEPWTRDGRVRAEVVNLAPDVSGRIVNLPVADNQTVRKGDRLFEIDPASYRLALAQAEAALEQARQDMLFKQAEQRRRDALGTKSVLSAEEWQKAQAEAAAAKAAYDLALAARDRARLDLARTVVRSPVNGYVTNLHLRIGDYASAGQPQISVLDSDSFWVAGYFEETKIPQIRERAPVRIELMGVDAPLDGHVETISRGIADANSGSGATGLASVDPIFTWVRLAQRIPVRIRIDRIPEGVRIAAGMTCTLSVEPPRDSAPPAATAKN